MADVDAERGDILGAGSLIRPAVAPPVAVLPLAIDDMDRPLAMDATDATDLADRTDWIDAFDTARSRCIANDTETPKDDDVVVEDNIDEDTAPGMATDDGGLVLWPWRDATDRRDAVDAVFGIPEDVRDCGRGTALVGVEEPIPVAVGSGGSAFDTGLGPTPPRRATRGTTCACDIAPPMPFSPIVGILDLRNGGRTPASGGTRVVSPADELEKVGVGLRSSSGKSSACG